LSLIGFRNFIRSVPPVPFPPALPSSFSYVHGERSIE
jgi:hypothetical protein